MSHLSRTIATKPRAEFPQVSNMILACGLVAAHRLFTPTLPTPGPMGDITAIVAELRSVQSRLVAALQAEFYCDDLDPPEECWGWAEGALREYFESGGETKPAAQSAPVDITEPAASGNVSSPNATITQLLAEAGLSHLSSTLAMMSWRDASSKYDEGRPKVMAYLKDMGVSKLNERTVITNAIAREKKKDEVSEDQPGGSLPQPSEAFKAEKLEADLTAKPYTDVSLDLKGYQAAVLAYGIPLRQGGLFPPKDPLLKQLAVTRQPFTKGLPTECANGQFVIRTTDHGWVSGENACEHGIDLRMFIVPGFNEQGLEYAACQPHACSHPPASARTSDLALLSGLRVVHVLCGTTGRQCASATSRASAAARLATCMVVRLRPPWTRRRPNAPRRSSSRSRQRTRSSSSSRKQSSPTRRTPSNAPSRKSPSRTSSTT